MKQWKKRKNFDPDLHNTLQQLKYRLTVWIDGVKSDSTFFEDFEEAIAATSIYYSARTKRSVLTFSTEIINGEFARSFASLVKSESIPKNAPLYEKQRNAAVKSENAFIYDRNFRFLIESELGFSEKERDRSEDMT